MTIFVLRERYKSQQKDRREENSEKPHAAGLEWIKRGCPKGKKFPKMNEWNEFAVRNKLEENA
jgi:hypothetical protein